MNVSHNICYLQYNCQCHSTNKWVPDTEAPVYNFQSHMSEMLKAVNEDGCNVTAYTFWSLLDSFEWDMGYT
jgi:beta-glucosidase/6-phospho-beta-glucosidase/beta-galactosidase